MTDYMAIFKTKESQNWAKCSVAIQVARLGILEFCQSKIKNFHSYLISKLPPGSAIACTTCNVRDVLPYSTSGHRCRVCKCPSKQCPVGICDVLRNEIEKQHRYGVISWKNTNIENWFDTPWEVAKCYFPPDGYKLKTTGEETDINGLISLILMNKVFESFSALPDFRQTWEKVSAKCFHIITDAGSLLITNESMRLFHWFSVLGYITHF